MPAVYANKFKVENFGDVLRIVCIDEHAPIGDGIPLSSSTATEFVVTRANAQALGELLVKMTS
jgi:hypothetical protein